MEYARLEIRFAWGGWSSGMLVTGAAGNGARGVVVRAADMTISHTLLKRRRRLALPEGSAVVGDASTPLPEESARLTAGAKVLRGKSPVGHVSALWCDRASSRIMHVVVRPSVGFLRRGPEHVLPAEHIFGVTKGAFVLDESAPALETLPVYRPDRAIEADLRLALAEALPAPSARRGVKALVEEGQVHLGGVVDTEEEVARARLAAEGVRGVREVVVDVVSAETLAARVEERAMAVLAAQQASGAAVRVLSEHGIVYLDGHVATREARDAVERAAKAVAGVRAVVNSLIVERAPAD